MKHTYKKMASGGKVGSMKSGPGSTGGLKTARGPDSAIGRSTKSWTQNTMTGRAANKISGGAIGRAANRLKAGGIVGAPARSHRDMRAGSGSGVGRIQKTKIQRGR